MEFLLPGTPELFDEAVNVLTQTDVSCVDGVKKDCPLNRLTTNFHLTFYTMYKEELFL